MIKCVFVMDLPSMNELPEMERWYIRYHAPEAINMLGPWMTRYRSYRAVPPPPGAEHYGYYNYRVSELWFRNITELPPVVGMGTDLRGQFFELTWPQWMKGAASTELYAPKWAGQPEGPHPWAQVFVPAAATEDFLGHFTVDEKAILRWYITFKYPDGVPVEEGEKWFLNVHSKEVMKQPGLIRYFSHRAIEVPGIPNQYPWHRVTEQWYENFDGWRKSVIDSPPKYTKPPWAKYDKYPFLHPYVDFLSTFLLERPTDDFLRDWRSYP